MTNVDRALLIAEWGNWGSQFQYRSRCPCCDGPSSTPQHEPGCAMDLALAERGFPTQDERDRARGFLRQSVETATTVPPPKDG